MTVKRGIIAIILVLVFVGMGVGATFTNSKFTPKEQIHLIIATPAGKAVDAATEKFKELCLEYSDGSITVDIFSNNLLGDDKIVIEGAQVGDIDIAVSSTSPVANMYRDYYLFDAAYLFLNTGEVYNVGFKGPTGKKIGNCETK